MGDPASAPPPGFALFTLQGAEVVCASHLETTLRELLRKGTLYQYGETHAESRALAGRGAAYAVALPGGLERVVIRHNRLGGLLAAVTGDLFAPPTRAPHELHVAERLRDLGVPTPRILAYITYPAGPFRRADVMSREVPRSADLSASLVSPNPAVRSAALAATAHLVRSLSAVGARHHDLNIKNVLLHQPGDSVPEALVLDVDRVTFGSNVEEVLEQNLARLLRSARKWQREFGAQVTDAELESFVALAREPAPRSIITSS